MNAAPAHRPRRARRPRGRAIVALALVLGALAATTAPAGADFPRLRNLVERIAPALVPNAPVPPDEEPEPDPEPDPTEPCGGVALPKPGGGAWACTFSDEFTGTALDRTKWVPQQTATSGYNMGPACFVDDPDNVSVSGGVLRLTARKERAYFRCQDGHRASFRTRVTSASVSTYDLFSQERGRFEVRARFPAAKIRGLQSAIWLWPDDPFKYGTWPRSGEIDIAEVFSRYPDRAIPFIHYASATNVTNNYCLLDPAQFHTYVAEWTETSIRILYDGIVCLDHQIAPAAPLEAPAPFDQPFMVALTQGLGVRPNAYYGSTPLPATTQVDYVRVWE